MKIFFGKIKPTADNKQIRDAYYETLSPAKLGEIQPGDYSFIISGKDVHLWKAKGRIDIDGHPKMEFDVIQNSLPLSTQKLIAFRYFKLDSSLMVLTVRQSPKAFYPIELADSSLTEDILTKRTTYQDEDNFRKIIVLPSADQVQKNSIDVQLYFDGNDLQIERSAFFDKDLFENFINNLDKLGKGRREKDKALSKISEGRRKKVVYNYNELPLLRMYDALFNPYERKDSIIKVAESEGDAEDVVNEISEALELKSYNQIYYGPPGTGKTYRVLKSFCLEEETALPKKEQLIKLDHNAFFWHLAPGRNAYLWEQLKKGDTLGYEWADKEWGDLKKVTPKQIEEEGSGSFQLITYLREVEAGDYICVISGKKLLGIAEVTAGYNFEEAKNNPFNFQTVPIKWLKQFDPPLYLNSYQTKTFVKLNDGRRWSSLVSVLRENGFYFNEEEVAENKMPKPKNFMFVSFHQSFSYEDFIEGIKPVLPDAEEIQDSNNLLYEIVPGVFYQACDKAAQLAGYKDLQDCITDSKKNRQRRFKSESVLEYYLIIDELNRGNVASIFGELITLIEDDKRLGGESEIILNLPYSKSSFGVPLNLRIIGTMNTADRSVEALDTALRRRFSFEEIIPEPTLLPESAEDFPINLRKLLVTINNRIEKLIDKDHTIGHAFLINVDTIEDLKKVFANKILPLLQEYFYGDYGRIGLVIGEAFLVIKKQETAFMKVDNYEAGDLDERTVYSLKNIDEMTDDVFTNSIKAIYGE
ncbi:MAG: AAA family ATPase [Bacteroidetes bacterium]|nr:AAA family ATPase [Bacteroidota bacterium]